MVSGRSGPKPLRQYSPFIRDSAPQVKPWNARSQESIACAPGRRSASPGDLRIPNDVVEREQRAALKRLVVAGLGMMQAMMYAIVLYAGASKASTRRRAISSAGSACWSRFRWCSIRLARSSPAPGANVARDRRWIRRSHSPSRCIRCQPGGDTWRRPRGLLRLGEHVRLLPARRTLPGNAARHRAGDVVDALARLQPAEPTAR